MATHFEINASIACGKNASADRTANPEQVTCKSCLRSKSFPQQGAVADQAPAKAVAPAPAPVEAAPAAKPVLAAVAPAASGKPSTTTARKEKHAKAKGTRSIAFAEWRARFGANDRLPRGKAFASK